MWVGRHLTGSVGGTLLVALVLGLNFYRLPVVVLLPGPAEDVLGQVRVTGRAQTYPSKGQLYLTSVGINDNVNFYGALLDLANHDVQVVPRDWLYPKGVSTQQVDLENAADMDLSKVTATVVAL